jgi:hypothetical protein
MSNQPVNDPWESGENPQVRVPEFWGQVAIDMYYVILQKGQGKVPFNPQQHTVDKRCTAIDIKILPILEMNVSYEVSRGMIAESREWAGIVLPSIKALGLSVRELNGKFVQVRYKATGETYTNKNGEKKEKTTFEFVKLYTDIKECTVDFMTAGGTVFTEDPNGHGPDPVGVAQPAATSVSPEAETAKKFLKVVVENAVRGQKDLQVIRDTISLNLASMPMINKHFTVDSPETMMMIMEAMSHGA